MSVAPRKSYEELYKKAIKAGRYAGLGDEIEDFAGWIVLQWLEGLAQHQTLDQSVIEYRRRHHSDPRHPGGLAKLVGKTRTISIASPGEDSPLSIDIERALAGSAGNVPPSYELSSHPSEFLSGRSLEIFDLYTKNEFTLSQIAERFGVTESRISQLLRAIKNEIFEELGLRKMLDRCEDGNTELSIDWIEL